MAVGVETLALGKEAVLLELVDEVLTVLAAVELLPSTAFWSIPDCNEDPTTAKKTITTMGATMYLSCAAFFGALDFASASAAWPSAESGFVTGTFILSASFTQRSGHLSSLSSAG